MTNNQSNKVLKKNNLRSGIEPSFTKLVLFHSLQMHHIKQWGITIQI